MKLLNSFIIISIIFSIARTQLSESEYLLNSINDNIPMNEYPFIMSHDVATGYLTTKSI